MSETRFNPQHPPPKSSSSVRSAGLEPSVSLQDINAATARFKQASSRPITNRNRLFAAFGKTDAHSYPFSSRASINESHADEEAQSPTHSQFSEPATSASTHEESLLPQSDAVYIRVNEETPDAAIAQRTLLSGRTAVFLLSSAAVIVIASDYFEDALETSVGLKGMTGKVLYAFNIWPCITITQNNLPIINIANGIFYPSLELVMNVRYLWPSMHNDSIFPLNRCAAIIIFPAGLFRVSMLGLSTYAFITDADEGLGWSQGPGVVFGSLAFYSSFMTQVRESYFILSKLLQHNFHENSLFARTLGTIPVFFDVANDIFLNYSAVNDVMNTNDKLVFTIACYSAVPFSFYSREIFVDAFQDLQNWTYELNELRRRSPSRAAYAGSKDVLICTGLGFLVNMTAQILAQLTLNYLAQTPLPFTMSSAFTTFLFNGIISSLTIKYTHAAIKALDYAAKKAEACFNRSSQTEYKRLSSDTPSINSTQSTPALSEVAGREKTSREQQTAAAKPPEQQTPARGESTALPVSLGKNHYTLMGSGENKDEPKPEQRESIGSKISKHLPCVIL